MLLIYREVGKREIKEISVILFSAFLFGYIGILMRWLESPAMQKLDLDKMRELREARELSQVDAARKAGMTVQYWNDIERGRHPNVTIDKLAAIAAALGVDARELLTPQRRPARK